MKKLKNKKADKVKTNKSIVKNNYIKKDKKKKSKYKIRNWREYNQSLVDRYDVTLWVEKGIADIWREGNKIIIKRKPKIGSPQTYSDAAIDCLATLQELFRLTYRGIEGFGKAILNKMLCLEVAIPDFSTINRRRKHLKTHMLTKTNNNNRNTPIDIILDSSGLKVYGEGEWKVRQHGVSKRRTWRKIHLGINPKTGEIEAVELTDNSVDDAAMVKPLINQVKRTIHKIGADGAYDKRKVYEVLSKARIKSILIPPRKGAHIWHHGNTHMDPHSRDEHVRIVRQIGRKRWKQESGYHMRSLVETGVYRYKTIFSDRLSAREYDRQQTEVKLKCKILNKMTAMGMPDSYKVDPDLIGVDFRVG